MGMATKKGKTVMMFVRVLDFVDKAETEEVTSLWQTGLYNNHVQAERFVIEDDRVMFMFRDGARLGRPKSFCWSRKDVRKSNWSSRPIMESSARTNPKRKRKRRRRARERVL